MTPTRTAPLLVGAAAVAVLGWAGLQVWSIRGHGLPAVPWTAPGVLALMPWPLLALGWPVRQWQRGRRDRPLDALGAARTALLAKAAQYAGALLTGWYAAQVLAVLPTADVGARRALAVRAALSLLAAGALWGAGRLVERWCRIADPT